MAHAGGRCDLIGKSVLHVAVPDIEANFSCRIRDFRIITASSQLMD